MDPIPPEILNAIPPKALVYALAAYVAGKDILRGCIVISERGGLVPSIRKFLYGAPKPIDTTKPIA